MLTIGRVSVDGSCCLGRAPLAFETKKAFTVTNGDVEAQTAKPLSP